MFQKDEINLTLIIIVCSITFLVFLVSFFILFRGYYLRRLKFYKEKQSLEFNFKQQLLQTQLEIQEQTLKTISEEIHDNVGQVLSLAKLNLNTLDNTSDKKIQDTKNLVAKAINDLRNLSRCIHGDRIAQLGLQQSIEDELNIVEKNRNYGWPTVNGPCDEPGELVFCSTNNVKTPIWSSGSSTIAVCGLDHYNNDRIPEWKNCLLMLTLKDASLRVLKLSADGLSITSEKTLYKSRFGRLRDICISPQGKVYLCTSNGGNSDMLLEISKP